MPQGIEGQETHTRKPLSEADREAPFEEIYAPFAKVGVIVDKVYSLEEIDIKGKRVHRHHPHPEWSWLRCDHPECELWQSKFDSTYSVI